MPNVPPGGDPGEDLDALKRLGGRDKGSQGFSAQAAVLHDPNGKKWETVSEWVYKSVFFFRVTLFYATLILVHCEKEVSIPVFIFSYLVKWRFGLNWLGHNSNRFHLNYFQVVSSGSVIFYRGGQIWCAKHVLRSALFFRGQYNKLRDDIHDIHIPGRATSSCVWPCKCPAG